MKRSNQYEEPQAPQRLPNDGEATVFASPDRHKEYPQGEKMQEIKIHDRLRGLFAITNGRASRTQDEGTEASFSVAKVLERQLGAPLDTILEHVAQSPKPHLVSEAVRQAIQSAFKESHRRLMLSNTENPGVHLRAHAAVARMIDVGPEEKTLFFSSNGKERLYLVRDGMVSQVGASSVMVEPGQFGEDDPMTVIHEESLEPGDVLVLMGDGTAGAVRGADVEEAAKQFAGQGPRAMERALQEFAKNRMEDPQNHEAKSGEISVVVWEAFPRVKPAPKETADARPLDGRRARLQARVRELAADIERLKPLAHASPSGRELVSAADRLVALEAERAAAELDLLNLDVPPRFAVGQEVAGWRITDYQEGKYYMELVRGEQVRAQSRWAFEADIPAERLPVHAGDRIRVEGFTANQKDDWHVMDTTQPADRFLFEDGKNVQHMAVPAGKVRHSLADMIAKGKTLHNQAFALKRQMEKSKPKP